MLLATAVIPGTDLATLVKSLMPVRVTIDEQRGRIVTLGRPEVQLVPGRGVRLRGDAHVSWDFAYVPIPVTINLWQLLLVPRIGSRDGSHILSFEPVLEELELMLVPGFVDEKVADAIRTGIAQNRDRLAWDFARTLSRRLPLPPRISPAKTFEILAVGGEVSVSESELRLVVQFHARFFDERSAATQAEKEQPSGAVRPTAARTAPS